MKNLNLLSFYSIVLACFVCFSSCLNREKNDALKSGDIVFCNYTDGALSDAIDAVTQTGKQTHYSHMGIVEITPTDTFIIHASVKFGVARHSYNQFLTLDKPNNIDVYRLSEEYQQAIPSALAHAKTLLNLPYNASYIMTDTAYYCSQMLYDIFKEDLVFNLEPMTFKNPGEEDFNEQWVNYYEKLGVEIPEGEPGCNPNGLANSPNIHFVLSLK